MQRKKFMVFVPFLSFCCFYFPGNFSLGNSRFLGIESLFQPNSSKLSPKEIFNNFSILTKQNKRQIVEFLCAVSQTEVHKKTQKKITPEFH